MPIRYLTFLLFLGACAAPRSHATPPPARPAAPDSPKVGVLLMAHGGDQSWNRSVLEGVRSLAGQVPTAVAFGMADPLTLAQGLEELSASGVRRVVVVRLFLSGESFRDRTLYLLGLSEKPPEGQYSMGSSEGPESDIRPILHGMTVATHTRGLMVSEQVAEIVVTRARAVSLDPERESVLILAHGMGGDAANQRVIAAMEAAAAEVSTLGFAAVRVATLREDWAAERERSEKEIRGFVDQRSPAGRRVIVIPFRLSGFGPYATVLEGLRYTAADGLLPHSAVSEWIRNTASTVACENGWGGVPTPPVGTRWDRPARPVAQGATWPAC